MPDQTTPDQPFATLPDAHRVVIVDDVDGRVFDESSRYEHGAVILVQDGGRTVKIIPAPEGQTTPITDDDRQAHEWASDAAPSWGPRALAAVRAIKAHVPAPPKTLADELRDVADQADGIHDLPDGEVLDAAAGHIAITARLLADRADELEERTRQAEIDAAGYYRALQQRDESRAEVDRLQEQAEARLDELHKYQEIRTNQRAELARLNAEVERLTSERTSKESLPVATSPDPADVPAGEAWEVKAAGRNAVGVRDGVSSTAPWLIIDTDFGGGGRLLDSQITLVARLVPEADVPDRDHMNHLIEPASVPPEQPCLVRDDQGLCLGVRQAPGDPILPWMVMRLCDGTMRRRADADVTMVRPIDISGLDINEVA